MKRIGKALAWLLVIVIACIIALLALLFVYEDEVKAAIIAELNKHLKAEVKIDPKNIDLTIIKTFPDCSIQFKNVLMLEALPIKQKDTLIFAGQLNLHFNIKDLWHKKYNIQKIKLKDGVIKLRVLKNGQNNYLFWEQNKTAVPGSGNLNFNLELLRLEHCRISYYDKPKTFQVALNISALDFKGNFKDADFKLHSEGKALIEQISDEKTMVLKNKQLDFLVDMDVAGDKYSIRKASLGLNQLQLEMNGGFMYKDSLSNLELSYHAPSLDIAALLSLLPEAYKNKIRSYESSGNFYAQGTLHYNSKKDFMLESEFGIKKGIITYKPSSTSLSNVGIDGHLKYAPNYSLLEFKNVSVTLKHDKLSANGSISNFSDPYLSFSADANLDLANLQAFWPIDTISKLQGGLKINLQTEGLWRDLKEQAFSTKVKLDMSASVNNLEAQFKNDEQLFSVAHGSVNASNRQIKVQDLELKRGSSDLLINGKLPGFFNYLSDPNEPLVITGSLFSNYIKLEDFMRRYNASGGEKPLIPANISFKLNAEIKRFTYASFEANAIAGEIDVKNQKAIVSDMHLNAMGGEASIDAFADNSKNKLNVVLQSKLKNINISQMFLQFNNFGQTTLQDKNIKGFASADLDFSGSWNNRLEPDLGSIQASCNLNIERGELINFKPLLSLSKFVDIQDLQHIRFSTLQSKVQIDNKTITLPKTELKNSALNISFWGSHTFNNEIDYHIQLLISELLAKKRKNTDNEFGPVEQDKRWNAFILMTGTVDKPIIKYDHKGLKEKIKTDIKNEKQNVRSILKEEFGLFKKDTASRRTNKSDQSFELEKPASNAPKKTLAPKKKPDEEDF